MRRALSNRVAPLLLIGALALTGCSSTEDEPTPTPSSSDDVAQTLVITVAGTTITPNGERIELAVGEEIAITVKSDAAGSFHVHSTPEQEVEFDEGETTTTLSFDRPGVVEMESHDPSLVVAQFEVR